MCVYIYIYTYIYIYIYIYKYINGSTKGESLLQNSADHCFNIETSSTIFQRLNKHAIFCLGSTPTPQRRGGAPRRGRHSTIVFFRRMRPCGGSLMVRQSTPKKWSMGAGFLGAPPISLRGWQEGGVT